MAKSQNKQNIWKRQKVCSVLLCHLFCNFSRWNNNNNNNKNFLYALFSNIVLFLFYSLPKLIQIDCGSLTFSEFFLRLTINFQSDWDREFFGKKTILSLTFTFFLGVTILLKVLPQCLYDIITCFYWNFNASVSNAKTSR